MVKIDGNNHQVQVHKLMVEAKLGRILVDGEDVDHINGIRTNALSNLRPILKIDNIMKSVVKLMTRIDSKGNACVFGSREVAAEVTGVNSVSNITNAIKSGQEHAGFFWKDSSVVEIAEYFRQMDLVDLTQDFTHLSLYPRHGNLLKSTKLYFGWKKALSS